MRSKIIYKEITLLSIKEGKSRKIEFKDGKNILHGKNDTGKSTILKTIYWSLGLNPTKLFSSGRLDKNLISLLKIDYNGLIYYFLRNKDTFKLFDTEKKILISTESSSEWQDFMAKLFDYKLSLVQRNNLEEYLVGLSGILTPYYIDQDSGWSQKWDGPFEGMYRYYDFYQRVIEHFTGVTSNDVIILKQKQKFLLNQKKELEFQIKIYEKSILDLLNTEKNLNLIPDMNFQLFEKNITNSINHVKNSQDMQISLKQELTDIYSEKHIVYNLLKNAYNLHANALADMDELNKIAEDSFVECPTCGVQHEKTFETNIALEFDIQGINKNIFNLNERLESFQKEEKKLKLNLHDIENEISSFEDNLSQSISHEYTFEDVIRSYSNINLRKNIEENLNEINKKIDNILKEIDQINIKIDEIDSPEIIKSKIERIKRNILYFYNQLNVDATEPPRRIYTKPNISGSSNSRSILALHLSYITMSYRLTDFPIFPIVIDTLQQNGQDDLNINNMIEIISQFNQPQIILGLETLPSAMDHKTYNVIYLNNDKYQCLNPDNYSNDLKEINSFIDMTELSLI